MRAYNLIGYAPDRDYRYIEINRYIRESFPEILAEIVAGFENAGGSVVCDPVSRLLSINDEFTASIVLARSFAKPCVTHLETNSPEKRRT